jgi:glycosyltransferase involved in cell wall biosynthesis
LKFYKRQVDLITIRSPTPIRYRKMLSSVSKMARVNLITGTLIPTVHLKMNVGTILSYASLLGKSFYRLGPAIIDVNAMACALLKNKERLVVDFRTPFPLELRWLGHANLASLARVFEKTLQNVRLVIAANERMALLCRELGARSVRVIPNYPPRGFKPTLEPEKWKAKHGLQQDADVVLFTGGERLREIYGLDLLLESWKLVENSGKRCFLVILGDDSVDHITTRVRSLALQRIVLPGRVNVSDVANWINCSRVCVAPRTPGFPKDLYNDKDSTKISEYAALRKPIVAAGYSPSGQYLLVGQTSDTLAEGIMKGLDGKVNPPEPHYWEENEPEMLSFLEDFWFR